MPALATRTNTHLQAALEYAARGWPVLPLYEIRASGRCACGRASGCQPGKHPRTPHGLTDASTDPAQLREWWARWPGAGIAIVTGAASGLVVVDVDPRNDGDQTMADLEREHGALPATLTALTGGGGQHYLFAHPGGRSGHLGLGIDLKSDGGYIVVAPTLHHSGRLYAWDAGAPTDPAPLPDWIASQLSVATTVHSTEPVSSSRFGAAFARAGMVRGRDGEDRLAVVCPWEHEHSTGAGAVSSTVIFPALEPGGLGKFHCSHGHCAGQRSAQDVIEWFRKYKPDAWEDRQPVIQQTTDWDAALIWDKGRLVACAENAAIVLSRHPAWDGVLSHDTLAGVIRWRARPPIADTWGASPEVGSELSEPQTLAVSHWLSSADAGQYQMRLGKESRWEAIQTAAHAAPHDPLREYLEALHWDGVTRITRWLTTYLGVEDAAVNRTMGYLWLVSAVARGLDRGCQVDHTLILEGPDQGEGKSTALRILAGPWFGKLPSLRDPVRAADTLRGRWIVEIGELDAIRGAGASAVKDFLTDQVDRFRPAYGRVTITWPRSCVFAGTTNESTYLDDPTGSRRWWPVTVGRQDREALVRDRDQLWAEAVQVYRSGAQWWPSESERAAIAEVGRERYEDDVWTDAVIRFLQARQSGVTTSEILSGALGLEPSKQTRKEQSRVKDILTAHRYVQVRPRVGDNVRAGRTWVKRV